MSATTVSPKPGPLAFWDRFCQQLEDRVREGNLLAGDSLWRMTASTAPAIVLSVHHVHRPADRVDCIFDPAKGLLTCTPGAEIPLEACQFQWVGGTADILRHGSEELTLSEALTLLLDGLVWPDE